VVPFTTSPDLSPLENESWINQMVMMNLWTPLLWDMSTLTGIWELTHEMITYGWLHMVLCFGFTFSLIIILLEKYHVLSVLLFICIWHSIVWAYKSDLLTRLQSLSPNYFYITQTLEYHTISWEINKNITDARVPIVSVIDWHSTTMHI
jgi:hypothetical protein